MIFDIKGQVVVVLEFTLGQVIEKDLSGGGGGLPISFH